MNKVLALAAALTMCGITAFAQPAIAPGGVVNNSSFAVSGLPGSALAPGSIFALFGSNLGPTTFTPYNAPGVVPTTLGGVNVTFTDAGGTAQPALLYYVTAGQIGGIIPSATATGTAQVTVTYNGQTSAPEPVDIVPSSFGITSLNGTGTGPGAIEDYSANYAIPYLSAPAKPGDVGIIYGTGLGAAPGGDQDANGQVPSYGTNLQSTVNAALYIGGVQADILYAGRSAFVGLDQINFTIPTGAPTGCYVPVILVVGGIVSNSPSMAISSDGSVCSDPMGLSSADISQAETSGLKVGSLLLTRLALATNVGTIPETVTEDTAQAHFYDFSGTGSSSPEFNRSIQSLSSFGSCQITYCGGTYTCVPSAGGLTIPGLDAGSTLTVSGANVPTVTLTENSTGNYSAALGSSPIALPGFPSSDYLEPGTFTFAGNGGADVGAFSASIQVPSPITWSSPQISGSAPSVSKGSDLTVNWTDSNASDYVLISLNSAANIGGATATYNSAAITCLLPASMGSYTIPSWLLQALPDSSTVSLLNGLLTSPTGAVVVGAFNIDNKVSIPGLDEAFANSLITSGATVTLTQ